MDVEEPAPVAKREPLVVPEPPPLVPRQNLDDAVAAMREADRKEKSGAAESEAAAAKAGCMEKRVEDPPPLPDTE